VKSFVKEREKSVGTKLPVTDAFINLFSQIWEGSPEEQEEAVNYVRPYNLKLFHENVLPLFFKQTGNLPEFQQDAAEFYAFLINSLQEEHAVKATTHTNADEASEWVQVNGKKRSVVLNSQTDFDSGPVASVFLGSISSSVRRKTSTIPSVSVQPFECLHLDISSARVNSVEEALELFQQPEVISGGLRRTMSFAKLPRVLCLHLKRFVYTTTSKKIMKPIEFDTEISLKPVTGPIQNYSLVAVVRHNGEATNSGHYIADVLYDDGTEAGSWFRCNDSTIDWIESEDDFFPV